jgi:hypothetical protein
MFILLASSSTEYLKDTPTVRVILLLLVLLSTLRIWIVLIVSQIIETMNVCHFQLRNYNRVKFKKASFKQTYAVQDVPQCPLVALRVVVKLAVAGAHFHFVFDALSNLLRQITQVTAAAQVWHVVLAHFRSFFVHKDLKCFDVPFFLKLMFSLLFFRHNLALSSIRIPTDPPLKLRRLILLNRDFCLCRFLLLAGLSEG